MILIVGPWRMSLSQTLSTIKVGLDWICPLKNNFLQVEGISFNPNPLKCMGIFIGTGGFPKLEDNSNEHVLLQSSERKNK